MKALGVILIIIAVILGSFGYTLVDTSIFAEDPYGQAMPFLTLSGLLVFLGIFLIVAGIIYNKLLDIEETNKRGLDRVIEAITRPENMGNRSENKTSHERWSYQDSSYNP